jgi:hypothetical protein
VLEHVGEAGLAFGVVYRANVDVGVEGNDGRVMAFKNDEVEAVGEGEFGDAFFEGFEVLGLEVERYEAERQGYGDEEFKEFH